MEAQISQFRDEWRKTNSRIVGALTLLILAGLPIIYQDYYFNILVVKYYYYCAMIIGMAVFTAIAAFVYVRRDRLLYGGEVMKTIRSEIKNIISHDCRLGYDCVHTVSSHFYPAVRIYLRVLLGK